MEKLFFISLFIIVPPIFICLVQCCFYCIINLRRRRRKLNEETRNVELPPLYDELVLNKKELPKFNDIVKKK